MTNPFYTIGHSTRALADFIALLHAAGVEVVADVRAFPRSRSNPQFNIDTLPQALAQAGIGYEHFVELGGRRRPEKTVPPARNAFWQNRSFHNYADYAESDAFRAGLARLVALGNSRRCAVMCSEAVWWRCHRRIIADYLLSRGESVCHIMGDGRIEPAKRTPGARRRADGTLAYPAARA